MNDAHSRTKSHSHPGSAGEAFSPTVVLRILHYPTAALHGFSTPLQGTIRIGREPGPEIELSLSADPRVSRRHATLSLDGDRFELRDHGSKNGSFVNGGRVDKSACVNVGDVLRFGDTLLQIDTRGLQPRLAVGPQMIAESGLGLQLLAEIDTAATTDTPVLLLGETGSGKELLAARVHAASARKGAFMSINCAAIPATLAEATFFGHKKGAYSGAHGDAPGHFDLAADGTLFFDEVGELALDVQAKLLRVLETGDFLPVGGSAVRRSHARVVAATNADLEARCRDGRFREDLLARLSGLVFRVPPLRERRADILPLMRSFLREAGAKDTLSANDAEVLVLSAWPRNARELRNLARQIAVQARLGSAPDFRKLIAAQSDVTAPPKPSANWHKETMDAAVFSSAAEELEGNVVRLAERFGTERRQIYRWAKRFCVDLNALRH